MNFSKAFMTNDNIIFETQKWNNQNRKFLIEPKNFIKN